MAPGTTLSFMWKTTVESVAASTAWSPMMVKRLFWTATAAMQLGCLATCDGSHFGDLANSFLAWISTALAGYRGASVKYTSSIPIASNVIAMARHVSISIIEQNICLAWLWHGWLLTKALERRTKRDCVRRRDFDMSASYGFRRLQFLSFSTTRKNIETVVNISLRIWWFNQVHGQIMGSDISWYGCF